MSKVVTPKEAFELIQKEGYTYVDVRSPSEYEASHPEGALNLPILFVSPEGRTPNPDFVEAFRKNLPPGAKVVLGCAGGTRAGRAAQLLDEAGWDDVLECRAGFGGSRDPEGRVAQAGWRDSGLPCESGQPEGRSWESLQKK